jgi:hypothetical protein
MAGVSKTSVGAFLRSLSCEELTDINPAEFFKLVEFVVLREELLVDNSASVPEIRDAVNEWCCASIHHWDVLEASPWFLGTADDKVAVLHHVARIRQKVSSRRAAERTVRRELDSITEEVLEELFEEA